MINIDSTIEKVLKKAPQYTRFKRHALSLLSHSTPKKLANLLAIELQRKIHRTKVVGYPYFLIIDPNNICNLRCPLCPSGFKETEMKREFVRIEDFKKIIDRLYPYAYEVALHNWGEPFLNPDIFEMIRYCKKKNIGTNLSTNLNISSLDTDEIIRSGLEYMVVSMDGTTQNVYSKYRVGGKIDLVFNNMVDLINKRKELKSKSPFIEWQYVVMKHNIHQIDDAKRMAKEIGVDTIRFIPVGLPIDAVNKDELAMEWFPYITSDSKENYIKDRFLQKPIKGGCFYLYRSVTINPVGVVAPCCTVYKENDNFGNMLETDFSEIWNNELYQNARALFSKRKRPALNTACKHCALFSKNGS